MRESESEGLDQQTQRGRRSSRTLTPVKHAMKMARLKEKFKRFHADGDQLLWYTPWERAQRDVESQTRARKIEQSKP